tara:strand:- start:72 stop:752 length:681 start_codon:yes stop_codon:yes gene_type:complete
MAVDYNPRVVTDGLVLSLDTANTKSHSGQYTYTWRDTIKNVRFVGYSSPQWNTTFNTTHLNGTNEYYENASGWTSFGTNSFSIVIWFRPHKRRTNDTLIGTNNTGAGTFDISFNGSQKIRFRSQDSDNTYNTTVSSTENNVFQQLVFVREGTGTDQFKIYKDGSLDTTGTVGTDLNSTDQLRIGRNRGGSHYYDGDLGIIRIHKGKALNATEVEQNYNLFRGRYGI